MKVRDLMKPHCLSIIGNGIETKLWLDHWHYEGLLVKRFGENVRHLSGLSKGCNVDQLLVNGTWFSGTTAMLILPIVWDALPQIGKLPTGQKDLLVWTATSKRAFTKKLAWNSIRQHGATMEWDGIAWCKGFIPKHSFVPWRVFCGKLPTQLLLRRYGTLQSSHCCFCWNHGEALNHLFFRCPFTAKIWLYLVKSVRPTSKKSRTFQAEATWIVQLSYKLPVVGNILKLLFNVTIYTMFGGKGTSVCLVIQTALLGVS